MNEQERRIAKHTGRNFRAQSFGDTPDELELTALDKARDVFGEATRLELVRDYTVREVSGAYERKLAQGKKLRAEIRVLVHD